MKQYIYGAGYLGHKLLENVKYGSFDGFIDSFKTGEVDGYPICKLAEIEKDSRVVIAIGHQPDAVLVYRKLHDSDYRHLMWYDEKRDDIVSCDGWAGGVLNQVEMHVVDYCNLNCRGCAHFAPIFERHETHFDENIRDIVKLKKKFAFIYKFFLLGGEPFLSDRLGDYCKIVRELLPDTIITIVTNGLLIPKCQKEILKQIKQNNVKVSISEYEPTRKYINEIKKTLEQWEIKYEIRTNDRKSNFNKPLTTSYRTSLEHLCISANCVTIWRGKIARCPTLMYINRFNEYFNENLPDAGTVSLDDDISGWELVDKLTESVPLCKYCVKNDIRWGRCETPPVITDFAVDS